MVRPKRKSGPDAAEPDAPAPRPAPDEALVEATLALVAARGWRRLTLAEVLDAAGVSPAEAAGLCARKSDLLSLVVRSVDRRMVAEVRPDPEESTRDRLFEVLMARFDALQAHREGMAVLVAEALRDPLTASCLARPLDGSMRWALRIAGVDASGLAGLVRARVLGLLYLSVLRVWLKDETDDLAPTMKALDRRLAQAEELANTFDPGRRRKAGTAPPAEAEGGEGPGP